MQRGRNTMLLQLDFSCETPIYRQIHDQIVLRIACGNLISGEKLPTIRALANEAGINMMTASKAYQLLKQEGHITTDRRGGTIVAGCCASSHIEATLAELKLTAASSKLSGMGRENWLDLCAQAYDSLNLSEKE